MIKNKIIDAKIVAHSLRKNNGDEVVTFELTLPRIILPELLTHRMFSRNTSSSRAIPFYKAVEAVKYNPFIPMAYQHSHRGMQGDKYVWDTDLLDDIEQKWLQVRDKSVEIASKLYFNYDITKQLCNRLLEPFLYTTMLVTTEKSSLLNFFELRCPQYDFNGTIFKSKEKAIEAGFGKDFDNLQWLYANKGMAEIHMMLLAEKMYDAYNNNTANILNGGEWHIPYLEEIKNLKEDISIHDAIKVSVSMCARVSYTDFDHNVSDVDEHINLFNRLKDSKPAHYTPFEHVCVCMTKDEYESTTFKGEPCTPNWCKNLKGFSSLRALIE